MKKDTLQDSAELAKAKSGLVWQSALAMLALVILISLAFVVKAEDSIESMPDQITVEQTLSSESAPIADTSEPSNEVVSNESTEPLSCLEVCKQRSSDFFSHIKDAWNSYSDSEVADTDKDLGNASQEDPS
jgi:hypothetical protein